MQKTVFDEAANQFKRLLEIMSKLRAPDGCAWDRKQTHASLREAVLEEAEEVADAIDEEDPLHLSEELGDLAMMIAFHAQIATEAGTFTMAEVMKGICEKLVNRHPHIFDVSMQKDLSPDEVAEMWEKLKTTEKANRAKTSSRMIESESFSSPVKSAFQVQAEAAAVGFDFPNPSGAIDKIIEEAKELKDSINYSNPERMKEELGDMFFAVINVARLLKLDPEEALRSANAKFVRRFTKVEQLAESCGGFSNANLAQMDAWWNDAKRQERPENTK